MTFRRRSPLVAALVCTLLLVVGCTAGKSDTRQTTPPPVPPIESLAPRPPGVYLDVAVSGRIQIVVQRIEFRRPVADISISVPVTDLTGTAAAFAPRIGQVSIEVPGGEPQEVGADLGSGDSRTVPVSPASSSVVLRYVVRGAVRQSDPASAGRSLALVSSLGVVPDQDLSTKVTVSGPVLNVGCSGPGDLRACGTRTATGWTLRRSATADDQPVFAQLDNP